MIDKIMDVIAACAFACIVSFFLVALFGALFFTSVGLSESLRPGEQCEQKPVARFYATPPSRSWSI